MFKQSEIGAKCSCDVPETVCKEHAHKRYRLPKGHYADGYYLTGGYYLACWWTLECERCKNRREDFFVYKWSRCNWYLVDGPMLREDQPRRYAEIYQRIQQLMPK